MRAMPREPRGFTILELMLALSLIGLAVVAVRTLLVELDLVRDRVTTRSTEIAREMNGKHLLGELVRHISSDDSAHFFSGTPSAASFISTCLSLHGWDEPCRASLTVSSHSSVSALFVATGGNRPSAVLRGAAQMRLIYFDESSAEPRWLDSWESSTALPAAVGIVQARDTLAFRVGAAR